MTRTHESAPFRVGIVGCGRISKNHMEAIAAVDGVTLSAVCDTDAERARAAGQAAGVPWYSSLEIMLRDGAMDVVTVCTPSGMHPEHGIAAARAGKHVISEKPMAVSLEAADRLVNAC